jgi:hypothetical protein
MSEKILQLPIDDLQYQVASCLENKRFVVIYSSESKTKLNTCILKTNKITTKILFDRTTDIELNLTCVYVVNNLNNVDESILENATIINFKTKFVKNVTNKNEKLVDPFIKTDMFNTIYKHAMFYYILQYIF